MTAHPEAAKARRWREARGLSLDQLAGLTGYSVLSIRWMEKGVTPPLRRAKGGNPHDRSIAPWVFQRYRMACAGVDRQLKTGKPFAW